jgi:hypothetical protein
MTDVSGTSPEPDQIIGTRLSFDALACVVEFGFKIAPDLARERRRDLLRTLQTGLTKSSRTTEY